MNNDTVGVLFAPEGRDDTPLKVEEIAVPKGCKMVSISGDGGFGQYPMEFSTAVKYGIGFSHNLLYNGQLGKISKEQRSGDWPIRETDLMNPSFAAFAKLCGGNGRKVVKTEDISDAIQKALAVDGPALVEIMTDAELV